MYVGSMDQGKKQGKGRLYDADKDEIYEGDFTNGNRQGDGKIFKRTGEVIKGDFRNNFMEGSFTLICTLSKTETDKIFKNARRTNDIYITVNKTGQQKVNNVLN
jgi:hypothetical protein